MLISMWCTALHRMGRNGRVQVVVVGFNHGTEGEQRVDEGALSEICQVRARRCRRR